MKFSMCARGAVGKSVMFRDFCRAAVVGLAGAEGTGGLLGQAAPAPASSTGRGLRSAEETPMRLTVTGAEPGGDAFAPGWAGAAAGGVAPGGVDGPG